ncbi:nucleoside recognition domain-containing protein [Plebeiibacterium marinum]|uniref:Spore maturation protein n=1 Tax=Plebeiibacterium marinum TaxID=2992111 RepID=A0AAE3MCI3_9BACT|nr:spore maturation protein [Plebeiobacterium marinum]MCW3805099.1 spore maturation protein [Plebeiobacterium marinum]
MVLNYIWIAFFLIAFVVALIRLIFFGDMDIFPELMNSTFSNAKTGFEISLWLTGVLSLWLGFMKIGEQGGVVRVLSRIISPLFNRLFPSLPKNHPVFGTIMMNLSANMLGLDNAATPMGLKAMSQLQQENDSKETASNAQIMFLVLNTSGLTIIPVSIMVYRSLEGAANPADIFIPILLATFFSTLAGILSVAFVQKIKLFDKVIMGYLGGLTAVICGLIYWLSTLPKEQIKTLSLVGSNVILFSIIILFLLAAIRKRVNVYEAFIEGAKEGFQIAVKIIPYLVAILVAIGLFRTSGAMDFIIDGIKEFCLFINIDTRFVDALPTALMKPLSGSGARGMMLELFSNPDFGVDSFAAKLASTVQGATDTTFYIIAVYFGSVGIKKTRHAISCGLIADFAGIVASIIIGYMFFG